MQWASPIALQLRVLASAIGIIRKRDVRPHRIKRDPGDRFRSDGRGCDSARCRRDSLRPWFTLSDGRHIEARKEFPFTIFVNKIFERDSLRVRFVGWQAIGPNKSDRMILADTPPIENSLLDPTLRILANANLDDFNLTDDEGQVLGKKSVLKMCQR